MTIKAVGVKDSKQGAKEPFSIIRTVKKIIKNITVEPLMMCWILPYSATYAAIENMYLEKACRALVLSETGFIKDACKLFVRKDEFNIQCFAPGGNITRFADVKNYAIKMRYPDLYASIEDKLPHVYQFLCDIEEKAQTKMSFINSIRNPVASIGPFIIVLFAGPWSDKKNLRIPCMLVPFIGEAIAYFTLFISAIFINGPVEFPAYSYRLIASATGAENLMGMGTFSYLSAISNEENRTFRFGIYQILMAGVRVVAQSISPMLIKRFDYTELFGFMIPVHIIGLLYTIFFLKEPVNKKTKEDAAYDNPAMSTEISDVYNTQNENNEPAKTTVTKSKNVFLEFFDPEHAISSIKSFLKKREHGIRKIIIIFMFMHFMINGITQGEIQNLFLYGRVKLNWDVDTYVYHNVYTIVMGLIGTSLAVGILSKILGWSDMFIIILSTILSIITRGVYISTKATIIFFIGTGIDLISTMKILGTRSIISKIVPTEDLSTMFAIMGLFEALSGFFFPYIYPTLYQYLLESPSHDVSEIFALSGMLFVFSLLVYIFLWKLQKRKEKSESDQQNVVVTKF